jgi:GDP-4-dehydro-6-deoxy-D-mannose reductase
MRRVLVTGARGFLAGPLIARLERKRLLFKIGRTAGRGVRRCDLTDPAQARAAVLSARPDEIYHLAGTTSARDWNEWWGAHVTATVNLLEALASTGKSARVVIAGSSGEYGAAGGTRRAKENSSLEPVTPYGSSKLAQTMAALSFNRAPLEIVVARIFNVLGPGTPESQAPGAFAAQIKRVAAGRQKPEIAVGDLSPRRDYVDARDVASALELLMSRGVPGDCYNIGSGRSISMRAVLRGLAQAAGVRISERTDPARLRTRVKRPLSAGRPISRCRAASPT